MRKILIISLLLANFFLAADYLELGFPFDVVSYTTTNHDIYLQFADKRLPVDFGVDDIDSITVIFQDTTKPNYKIPKNDRFFDIKKDQIYAINVDFKAKNDLPGYKVGKNIFDFNFAPTRAKTLDHYVHAPASVLTSSHLIENERLREQLLTQLATKTLPEQNELLSFCLLAS